MVVHDSTRARSQRRGIREWIWSEALHEKLSRDAHPRCSHPVPPPWPPRLRARTPNAPQVIGGAGAQSVAARWFTRRREDAEGGWSFTIRREPARSAGAPKWIWSEAFQKAGRDVIEVSHPVPPPWPPRLRARTPNAPQVIGGAGAQSVAARWFTRRREDAEGGWSFTIRREPARSAGAPKWIWSEAFKKADLMSSRFSSVASAAPREQPRLNPQIALRYPEYQFLPHCWRYRQGGERKGLPPRDQARLLSYGGRCGGRGNAEAATPPEGGCPRAGRDVGEDRWIQSRQPNGRSRNRARAPRRRARGRRRPPCDGRPAGRGRRARSRSSFHVMQTGAARMPTLFSSPWPPSSACLARWACTSSSA